MPVSYTHLDVYKRQALLTVEGKDLAGNIGNVVSASGWNSSRTSATNWAPTIDDSDGPTFYIDTACDTPSLYKPDQASLIPNNENEANLTFYKISDLSTERPKDPGQNNCITYTIQYSTSETFSKDVITQSVDINESYPDANKARFCGYSNSTPPNKYNNWYITWDSKPPGPGFSNLRMHKSQALANGTWYWRVSARDALGNQSPYSAPRKFLISSSAPNLFSPTDLSLLRDNNVSLKWYNVSLADRCV